MRIVPVFTVARAAFAQAPAFEVASVKPAAASSSRPRLQGQQLGLELESAKAPVSVLVVDSAAQLPSGS